MISVPQILLSSEVFQMAEYDHTKPSELLDHDYSCPPYEESSIITIHKGKFFIMSTEFDKNNSDWSYDCNDHKNGIDFFMRLVKWPKIDVKVCQNLIFKVDFQRQKSVESF